MFYNKIKLNKNTKKYSAFTLAELLITIVVIGIVAALTVPGLQAGYQKKMLYTQFMKAYNTLTKVVDFSAAYDVAVYNWSIDINNPDSIIENYLKRSLKITKEELIKPYTISDLNNKNLGALNNYVSSKTGGGTKQYLLADGISLMIGEIIPDGVVFLCDVNGEKAPNIIGRDIFLLLVRPSDGNIVSKVEIGQNNANCGGTPDGDLNAGEGCADRLLKERKMDY